MAVQQERRFAANAAAIPAVRHWVTALAEQTGFMDGAPDIALATTEAASNVVRHSGSESLTVAWRAEDDHAVVELSDEGVYGGGVASPLQKGGLGLLVMTAVMDEVSIQRGAADRPGTRGLVKRRP